MQAPLSVHKILQDSHALDTANGHHCYKASGCAVRKVYQNSSLTESTHGVDELPCIPVCNRHMTVVRRCPRLCRQSRATLSSRMQSDEVPVDGGPIKSLGVEELMQLCIQCCASFKPAQFSLDAHADTFLTEHKIQADSDRAFVRQVLYGTVRYEALLTCFLKAFYHKNR